MESLSIDSIKLYGEFYFLDIDERNRFINGTHQYLIEQVQLHKETTETTDSTSTTTLPLKNYKLEDFKHPVKYMAWCVTNPGTYTSGNSNAGRGPCYFTSLCPNSEHGNDGTYNNSTGEVQLRLNTINRFNTNLPMDYFTRLLPKRYCKGSMPNLDRIGIYSFAINPFSNEPSGACNFSRLLNIDIDLTIANNDVDTVSNKTIYIFAVNYNVLMISSGMGGLLYI